jgi:hypothetical protein
MQNTKNILIVYLLYTNLILLILNNLILIYFKFILSLILMYFKSNFNVFQV